MNTWTFAKTIAVTNCAATLPYTLFLTLRMADNVISLRPKNNFNMGQLPRKCHIAYRYSCYKTASRLNHRLYLPNGYAVINFLFSKHQTTPFLYSFYILLSCSANVTRSNTSWGSNRHIFGNESSNRFKFGVHVEWSCRYWIGLFVNVYFIRHGDTDVKSIFYSRFTPTIHWIGPGLPHWLARNDREN